MPKNNEIRKGKKRSIALTTSSGTTTEQTEIWKDITGYEGLYQVSNLGIVKSLDRYRKGKRGAMTFVKGRILSLTKGKHGYIQASLHKDNKQYAPLVHRLVGTAFIPNERNLSCIDHIDSNRANNCVENLRWCTTKENMNFDMVRKNISNVQKTSKKCIHHLKEMHNACRKPVVIVSPNGMVKEYELLTDVEKDGFNRRTVAGCCNSGKPIDKRKFKGYKCYWKENYGVPVKRLSKESK